MISVPRVVFNRVSCVYFLFVNEQLIYIGKSVNLYLRLTEHTLRKAPDLDEAKYIMVPIEELDDVETALIRYFMPERNGHNSVKFFLCPKTVEKEINIVNNYVPNPSFDASKHISLLQHSMFIKHGKERYTEVYNIVNGTHGISESEKVIKMKRLIR